MRLIGLFAVPMIVALATPVFSQEVSPTDPMIDTFETSSVNPNPGDDNVRPVRATKAVKVRELAAVAEAEVVMKPRKARYRPGILLPAGMAF
jgi:hypothetical protein